MRRILCVDDQLGVLQGLKRAISPSARDWDMQLVAGGDETLQSLGQQPFDVIIVDMSMPSLGSAALLRRVQEQYPQVVRIMLVEQAEYETALRTVPAAHQFLTKPTTAAKVMEVVERTTDLQQLLSDGVLRRIIAGMDSLPAMPRVYWELTEALANPEKSLRQIAAIVERDPAICTKVLQLVNSAYFGLPRRLASIQHAVTFLGTGMLKNVVLALEVFRGLPVTVRQQALTATYLQRHALLTAGIASRLFEEPRLADDAFVASMLHDVGKLVLATRLPEPFGRCLEESKRSGRPLYLVEAEETGVTHAEVGAYLLGLWGLPYPIVEAVANHHAPGRVNHQEFGVLAGVYLANAFSHELAAETPGLPDGASDELDTEYLQRLGIQDRVACWRELAAEFASEPAAVS